MTGLARRLSRLERTRKAPPEAPLLRDLARLSLSTLLEVMNVNGDLSRVTAAARAELEDASTPRKGNAP